MYKSDRRRTESSVTVTMCTPTGSNPPAVALTLCVDDDDDERQWLKTATEQNEPRGRELTDSILDSNGFDPVS